MPSKEETKLDPPIPPGEAPSAQEWRKMKDGREYVSAEGRSGVIFRRDTETVQEAKARDSDPELAAASAQQAPHEKRAERRRKPPRPPMPSAPKKLSMKELEATLTEALKSPAIIAAGFGDEWLAGHFERSAPYLSRNLIAAADHNPWLRRRLEDAISGEDAMLKVMSLMTVAGALFMYIAPPIIYLLNPPVPDRARIMLGIPERKERTPDYAATTNGATGAASATGPIGSFGAAGAAGAGSAPAA